MKIKNYLVALLITICAIRVGYSQPPKIKPTCNISLQVPNVETKNQSIETVYTSQIGVRERTGNNDGVDVEKYLKSVGLTKGYAWCAAFVKWCYDKAGVNTTGINAMALSLHDKNKLVYYQNKIIKEPQKGDAFTLYYLKLGRIGHTGFYDGRLNDVSYRTVEGNTNEQGSREGDGVYRKYRSYRATYSINRWVNT